MEENTIDRRKSDKKADERTVMEDADSTRRVVAEGDFIPESYGAAGSGGAKKRRGAANKSRTPDEDK